jgi:hypothetical protein
VAPAGIVVTAPGAETRLCNVLEAALGTPRLVEGDVVMAWLPPDPKERGVILGRIAAMPAMANATETEELVITARRALTLRVGDSSITLRADGKILIKGKDLVSHAQRTIRIKGGSVAIN